MTDRRKQMNKYIQTRGFVSISELSAVFPAVSTMTIRRDLEFLEDTGEIVRTKGGAKSIMHLSMQKEEAYYSRENINSDLKMEIAQKVCGLIEENSCVYFDAGSTAMYIVKSLENKRIFAITSGPNVALELLKHEGIEVSVLGGGLNRENIALSGFGATEFVRAINIGTAIIAASGYSEDYGFTCGNFDENELKKAVIKSSARVIVVMDSTKTGKNHPFTFAKPEDVDIFVTDSKMTGRELAAFKKSKIKII